MFVVPVTLTATSRNAPAAHLRGLGAVLPTSGEPALPETLSSNFGSKLWCHFAALATEILDVSFLSEWPGWQSGAVWNGKRLMLRRKYGINLGRPNTAATLGIHEPTAPPADPACHSVDRRMRRHRDTSPQEENRRLDDFAGFAVHLGCLHQRPRHHGWIVNGDQQPGSQRRR